MLCTHKDILHLTDLDTNCLDIWGSPRPAKQYAGPPMGMPMPNTMSQQMPGNYPPGYGPHPIPGSNMGMGDPMMHGYNMPK